MREKIQHRGRKLEDGRRKAEVGRGRKLEGRSLKLEVGSQKLEVGRGKKLEVGREITERKNRTEIYNMEHFFLHLIKGESGFSREGVNREEAQNVECRMMNKQCRMEENGEELTVSLPIAIGIYRVALFHRNAIQSRTSAGHSDVGPVLSIQIPSCQTGSTKVVTGRGKLLTGSTKTPTGRGAVLTGNTRGVTGRGNLATGSINRTCGSQKTIWGQVNLASGSNKTASGWVNMTTGSNKTAQGRVNLACGPRQMWLSEKYVVEVGSRKSEVGSQKLEKRRGRKFEDGRQKAEVGRERSEFEAWKTEDYSERSFLPIIKGEYAAFMQWEGVVNPKAELGRGNTLSTKQYDNYSSQEKDEVANKKYNSILSGSPFRESGCGAQKIIKTIHLNNFK